MTIDVIRLAREAGSDNYPGWPNTAFLERFAALVAAAEREECAKVCESLPMQQGLDVRDQAAAATRARKP